jgi:hypothetical protein
MSAPRIYCIPATRAPVAAVLARGPSDWVRLGRWDVEHDEYEHGAWLAGTVYPQRCDLSPDGRWFAYFALKPSSTWDAGSTYIAVSRLPWFACSLRRRTPPGSRRGGPEFGRVVEVDLSADEPDPQPPPDEARRW